ncbi:MAG: hypothetical protein C5B59_09255 [Bacteroidetes bacterium]|nr:MAG: hypothetical protein C5B59_09255 [Bacteroidota bacterium]
MTLLNIFQNNDGTFSWENMAIVLIALIAGYILHQFTAKKKVDQKYISGLEAWDNKYKKLENEFKNYKSNITTGEKQSEKTAQQLNGRVKALEGDIRVLSDDRNKLLHVLTEKDEGLKKYSRQISDLEDSMKSWKEAKARTDAEWAEKVKSLKEDLTRAAAWEQRVKGAEEEAQKAKSMTGNAERRKLEAELRLKTVSEYAGKVVPLENELAIKNKLINEMQELINGGKASSEDLKIAMAQLELQRENNSILQQEFEMKHASNISLVNELEHLKSQFRKLAEENDMLKSKSPEAESLS